MRPVDRALYSDVSIGRTLVLFAKVVVVAESSALVFGGINAMVIGPLLGIDRS